LVHEYVSVVVTLETLVACIWKLSAALPIWGWKGARVLLVQLTTARRRAMAAAQLTRLRDEVTDMQPPRHR
jgi:hypothetical protein